eukprot:4096517-Amphidinium_carterae.1
MGLACKLIWAWGKNHSRQKQNGASFLKKWCQPTKSSDQGCLGYPTGRWDLCSNLAPTPLENGLEMTSPALQGGCGASTAPHEIRNWGQQGM